jgi:hypothetical protein
MKTRLLIAFLLVCGAAFAGTHISIGIGLGGYYPPPVAVYQPPCPGPGFYWTPGSWYWSGPRHLWRHGYWAPRPHWVGPRYYGHYDRGWDRGDYRHEFRERHDRRHDRRDFRRDRYRDRGRGRWDR